MNLSQTRPPQDTILDHAAPSKYREAAHWIASNSELPDAQDLANFMLFLSTAPWSYTVAWEHTERMPKSALVLALRVLRQYFNTGRCPELQRVAGELRSLFPNWSDTATCTPHETTPSAYKACAPFEAALARRYSRSNVPGAGAH